MKYICAIFAVLLVIALCGCATAKPPVETPGADTTAAPDITTPDDTTAPDETTAPDVTTAPDDTTAAPDIPVCPIDTAGVTIDPSIREIIEPYLTPAAGSPFSLLEIENLIYNASDLQKTVEEWDSENNPPPGAIAPPEEFVAELTPKSSAGDVGSTVTLRFDINDEVIPYAFTHDEESGEERLMLFLYRTDLQYKLLKAGHKEIEGMPLIVILETNFGNFGNLCRAFIKGAPFEARVLAEINMSPLHYLEFYDFEFHYTAYEPEMTIENIEPHAESVHNAFGSFGTDARYGKTAKISSAFCDYDEQTTPLMEQFNFIRLIFFQAYGVDEYFKFDESTNFYE